MNQRKLRTNILNKIVLIVIPLFFIFGWFFSYFYPLNELPLGLKSIKRFELKRKLSLPKTEEIEIIVIQDEDTKTYVRRLVQVRWNGLQTEAYLLVPKGYRIEYPAILVLHGHHTTKEDIVGIGDSRRFNINFGIRLVEAGYVVFAPDIPFSRKLDLEDHIALNLIMTGTNLMGYRVSYLDSLLDYLDSLPVVENERLGCVGWSMGGGLAMYLSAFDKRIKVVAISNYFGTYRETFMRVRQSTDNYIPGILTFGEMSDVACLIAPRPIWIEGCDQDPEFPLGSFMDGVERIKVCYKGNGEHLTYKVIKGRHRFQGEDIVEWFKKNL